MIRRSGRPIWIFTSAIRRQANRCAWPTPRQCMDRLVVRPDDPDKLLWWWCDALFMSPPVLLRMYEITARQEVSRLHGPRVVADLGESLQPSRTIFTSATAATSPRSRRTARPIFWSRGNGWVMGALVNVLRDHAGRLSVTAEVCRAVSRDGCGDRCDSERRRPVALRPARS